MNFILKYSFPVVVFFICVQQVFSQNNWEKLNSPTDQLLRNLYAVNENYVWAAGGNGTIIRTTNGGEEWSVLNTGISTFIYDVFFWNENIGWALSFPFTPPFIAKILKTTDSGESWKVEDYPESFIVFRTICFLDSLNGFIGGNYIAKTNDGGISWTRVNVDSSLFSDYPVIKIKFYNEQFGYASGGSRDKAGVMWRTTDGGENWSAQGISPDEVFDFYIIDSVNVFALSGDPEGIYPVGIVQTTDGGINWTYTNTDFFALSFAIDFRTKSEAWSASGSSFLFSSDSGVNWVKVDTPDSAEIYDLQFIDEYTGFGSGTKGSLIRIKIDKPELPSDDSSKFFLEQNYPNPFSTSTSIMYQVSGLPSAKDGSSYVTIKVYDLLGNEVATLVNELKPAGIYEVEFKPKNLSSGVYFYSLKAGDFFQTKKMIYIR